MKELTVQQIEHNWKKLRDIIQNTFDDDRLINLNKMYDYFEDRMCMAPASGKEHYHYAHVGGYVEHVLHIIDYAQQINTLGKRMVLPLISQMKNLSLLLFIMT